MLQCSAQRKAVEPRHEHIADHDVGAQTKTQLDGPVSIVCFAHLGSHRAQHAADEPGHGWIVVGDQDLATIEAWLGLLFRLGTSLRRSRALAPPRGHGQRPFRTLVREPDRAAALDGQEVANSRDRAPDRGENVASIAQLNGRRLALHQSLWQPPFDLLDDDLSQILYGRLPERRAMRCFLWAAAQLD